MESFCYSCLTILVENLLLHIISNVGRVVQSVQRLTTGWTVRDRIPVGTRFSAHPDRPWGPPSLLYNGYRVFPGCKVRPGRAADHSPPSSAAVMEEQSYTSTQPLGHTGPVTGPLYFFFFFLTIHYQVIARSRESIPQNSRAPEMAAFCHLQRNSLN